MGNLKDELQRLKLKFLGLPKSKKEIEPDTTPVPEKKYVQNPTGMSSRHISEEIEARKELSKGVTPIVMTKERYSRDQDRPLVRNPMPSPENPPKRDVLSPENLVETYGAPETKSAERAKQEETVAKWPLDHDFGVEIDGVLTRIDDFSRPAPWVSIGIPLQPPGNKPGPVLPVRIGIDFGTAYTKVAIRAASNVFFVRWGGFRSSGDPLFLPGQLSVMSDNEVLVGRAPRANESLMNLKAPFLPGAAVDQTANAAVVAFLGWVIRYSRAWLYHNQPALVKDRKLAWEMNIGCPTNAWGNKDIIARYRHLALGAWRVSQSSELITLAGAGALLEETSLGSEAENGIDSITPIPEFIAQIAGYVQSPQRTEDLHLLVDCGAGTLDIVTFNVYREPGKTEDIYPMFSSDVRPLGSHFLMQARAETAMHKFVWDDAMGIPTADEMSRLSGIPRDRYEASDVDYRKRIHQAVWSVLDETRRSYVPFAEAWKSGIPVFLTGGGASCDVYRDAVTSACTTIGPAPLYTPFPIC